jgi:hypothetical protein
METLPLSQEARASSAQPASTQVRLEIKSVEISTGMTTRRDGTDEELELIEMRYRHALTLTKLEDVFAEGHFDSR